MAKTLPDLQYKNRGDLTMIRTKLDELRGRQQTQSTIRRLAQQKVSAAEAAALKVEVSAALGETDPAEVSAAQATLQAARTDLHRLAQQDPVALETALQELGERYRALEETAHAEALAAFRPVYAKAMREYVAALEALKVATGALMDTYQYGAQALGPQAWPVEITGGFFAPHHGFVNADDHSRFAEFKRQVRQAGLLD